MFHTLSGWLIKSITDTTWVRNANPYSLNKDQLTQPAFIISISDMPYSHGDFTISKYCMSKNHRLFVFSSFAPFEMYFIQAGDYDNSSLLKT